MDEPNKDTTFNKRKKKIVNTLIETEIPWDPLSDHVHAILYTFVQQRSRVSGLFLEDNVQFDNTIYVYPQTQEDFEYQD